MSPGLLRLLASVVALLPAPAVVAADADPYSAEYEACSRSPTVQIVECVQGRTKAWDARLNRAYRAVLRQIDGPQKQSFNEAQLLWIKYRDANCRYYAMGQGSIGQVHAAECLRTMTARRTCELEEQSGGLERSAAGPGCR